MEFGSGPLPGLSCIWEGKVSGKVSGMAKLEPGMAVWLYDEKLGKMNYGFKKMWSFGVIGEGYGREPGYQSFWLQPHFFTITCIPIPVCISAALIAIPNHLVTKRHHFDCKWYLNKLSHTRQNQTTV